MKNQKGCQQKNCLTPLFLSAIISPAAKADGEWCNGSTYDSDSYCLGSNPSSPAFLFLAPLSRGLGRGPLKAETRVRIPSELLFYVLAEECLQVFLFPETLFSVSCSRPFSLRIRDCLHSVHITSLNARPCSCIMHMTGLFLFALLLETEESRNDETYICHPAVRDRGLRGS